MLSAQFFKTSFSCKHATDETEDEDVNKEYVEETNRDAVMIAAAKVVATEAVPKVSYRCCHMLILVEDVWQFCLGNGNNDFCPGVCLIVYD